MTPDRHGSAIVELPNDLDLLITREYDAPIALVFDVLTKQEHVSRWFAPRGCEMTKCSIELRVGGSYHQVFVTDDGIECSFRGTYLEVEPPTRTVATWLFEGRPHINAVESVDLHEAHGVTKMTTRLTFNSKADRDEDIKLGVEGVQQSFDNMDDLLRSLLAPEGTVAGK